MEPPVPMLENEQGPKAVVVLDCLPNLLSFEKLLDSWPS
jgi:hypothetical protein